MQDHRTLVHALLITTATVLITCLSTASAHAAFGISSFGGSVSDDTGARDPRAGAHVDYTTEIRFSRTLRSDGVMVPDGQMKNVHVDLPAGLVGNPEAIPGRCSLADVFNGGSLAGGVCPIETQVGIVYPIYATSEGSAVNPGQGSAVSVVEPPPGVAARFAFNVSGVVTVIDATPRADRGYALSADIRNISQTLALVGARLTMWGVPAAAEHDIERWDPVSGQFLPEGVPSTSPRRAFVTAPTSCSTAPLVTTATANSWQAPEVMHTASFDRDFDGFALKTEACENVAFLPTLDIAPSTTAPDAPAGLDVDVVSPQNLDSPDGLGNAHLRNVTVTLPDGMTINPGSAEGLQACSDMQLSLGTDSAITCPAASKVGTVTATSPLLKEELSGGVYVRSQASNDPASGDMFRLAVVLRSDERGVLVKLPGAVRVDPTTGQIVTKFDNNPQLPVDHIALHLKSGSRAPLATPASCGVKTVDVNLTSWAGHDVNRSSSFAVPCAAGLGGFSPALSAGTVTPKGGAFSPFVLSIVKPDGNSAVNGLRMELPEGLTAKIAGNLGTQVGTATVLAGPGSQPFSLAGQVFLEGAYGDAPFSLKVVVPAKAGPFDLGVVTVMQKVYVDPIDAHVTVVSDPIPTIVKGVPVRLQRLDVEVDKAGFVVNPTSCAPKSIRGVLHSVADQTAGLAARFQVGDCTSLDFEPDLGLTLSGKGQTTDGKHPAVTANLTQKPGQANLKKVRVALPLSLALDPDNANGLCEFVDGTKVTPTCPKNSVVGTATATTPILDEPLSGPVYFVKNIRKDPKSGREIRTLPKLVIPLVGQNGVKLTLTGTSAVEDDQLVTTFDNIPDASVSSFKLNINGGKGGILVVSDADICKATQVADQQVDGQNNKSADADVFIQTPSCALKVLSMKVTAKAVTLKVGGLGAGKVTVSGKGIKKTTKTITKSTVATITVKRTKGTPGKVTVSYDPTGPAKARKTTK